MWPFTDSRGRLEARREGPVGREQSQIIAMCVHRPAQEIGVVLEEVVRVLVQRRGHA
jgi:hypothetical protein